MARQLTAAGQRVELLALLDTAIPRFYYSLKFKFSERWGYLRTIGLGGYMIIHISRAVKWIRRKFGFSDGTETEGILKAAANKYIPPGYLEG